MNIAVIGAGIVGLSTALELVRDGHSVTLYEQHRAVAECASFACGGWALPAIVTALACPGAGRSVRALRAAGALKGHAWPATAAWRWLRQFERHAKGAQPGAFNHPTHVLSALAHYSQNVRWRGTDRLQSQCQTGALVLLDDAAALREWTERLLPLLESTGTTARLITPAQARHMEPGLGEHLTLHGAIELVSAESFNPRLLAQQLRQQLVAAGARLWTGAQVQAIDPWPIAVQSQGQKVPYEGIVLCTGADMRLPAQLGVRLPLLHLRGYSLSAPVREAHRAPRASVLHWADQMVIGRMDGRVRISAGAEMGSSQAAASPDDEGTLARMYDRLNDLFPRGVQLAGTQLQSWRGVCAALPDGLPAVGESAHAGIWLNIGHGVTGAATAAGCARALADLIAYGHSPSDGFNLGPLRPDRFA